MNFLNNFLKKGSQSNTKKSESIDDEYGGLSLPISHYSDVMIRENSVNCPEGWDRLYRDLNVGIGGNNQAWCAKREDNLSPLSGLTGFLLYFM